jgi:phosphoserine phosphatase
MRPGSLSAKAPPRPRIALFSDVDGTLLSANGRLAISASDVTRIAPHAETGARTVLRHAKKRRAPYAASVSIGNESNDQSLLEATNVRFAIRNPRRGHHDDLLGIPDVTPLASSGARAWRVALAKILQNGKA